MGGGADDHRILTARGLHRAANHVVPHVASIEARVIATSLATGAKMPRAHFG